jgi:hypothetical protein
MREDYLWDRSGPPDPDIERLEVELGSLRYRFGRNQPGARRQRAPGAWLAAAAAVLLAAGALLFRSASAPAAPTAWRMGNLAVLQGQVLRTGDLGVTLESEPVGRVELGPGSELRAATSRHLELRRGRLHAFIWAPPREFVVETASAQAVDLGCEYTLDVDGAGNGMLRVETGWVAFQSHGHESFIPAGAACPTRKREGPGIPFYEDAPQALTSALAAYESGDQAALPRVLAAARSRDGLTLWHLLPRVPAGARGDVFDRFAQLVGVPRELRAAAVRGEAKTLDLCWNALNLEDAGWWRGWERPWR